jgi:hypothetical protein
MPANIFAGWAEQTGYTTDTSPTQYSRIYDGSALNPQPNREPRQHLGRLDPQYWRAGVKSGQWTLEPVAVYDGLGLFFKHGLGFVTHTSYSTDTSYTKHTVSLADSVPDHGLAIELCFQGPDTNYESKKAIGSKVNEIQFEAVAGEAPRITVNGPCRKVELTTKSSSPTFPDLTTEAVLFSDITVTVSSTEYDCRACRFTINNNLMTDRSHLGKEYIAEPLRAGKREITGELEIDGFQKAFWDKFIDGNSPGKLTIECAGTGSRTWKWEMADIRFDGSSMELNEAEKIPHTVQFRAFYESTDGAVKFTEINQTATY